MKKKNKTKVQKIKGLAPFVVSLYMPLFICDCQEKENAKKVLNKSYTANVGIVNYIVNNVKGKERKK